MEEKELNYKHLKKSHYGELPDLQNEGLQNISRPHIESFNYMLRSGLEDSVKRLVPVEFALPSGERIYIKLVEAVITPPTIKNNSFSNKLRVYPAECRERGTTYRGALNVTLSWKTDGDFGIINRSVGEVPIMVKSEACNLHEMTPKELVDHGEEPEEMGGYFIINGNEKLIRMLVMQRRNYPMALERSSWAQRGPAYTEYGVSMRCVGQDQTSATIVLHYLSNGTANLCFTYLKEQFFVPVIVVLKALMDVSDQYMFTQLTNGKEEDSFYRGCITNMLHMARKEGLASHSTVLGFVGKRFRIKIGLPPWRTDAEVTKFLLRHCICIHLANNKDKFNTLVHMTKKLFALAKGECGAESADNVMFQEVLLGGNLYQMVLKERLQGWLEGLKATILKKVGDKGPGVLNEKLMQDSVRMTAHVTQSLNYLLATGNVASKSGLGLMQSTGMTIVAEKLNFFRYLSHFRAIHRGAFFSEMRTTAVRKLLPEAWGFICPVHTPDGSPCGLLNHLSARCEVLNKTYCSAGVIQALMKLGMCGYEDCPPVAHSQCYPVMVDGRLVGWVQDNVAQLTVDNLRKKKLFQEDDVPNMAEIVLVPKRQVASQYPGIFIFTGPTRMMRPVHNLVFDKVEMVGTFEQVYMEICITEQEELKGLTTHMELTPDVMLSVLASLTPFSDYNQSPRNIYQCQMGKQTMGTPLSAYQHRADNKLYRIQTPQAPMVKTEWYDHYSMDDYPLGTNACVAVISYTGYDMEDAMIINKSGLERGFGHGCIYKSEFIRLSELSRKYGGIPLEFGCDPAHPKIKHQLDVDGLPWVGKSLQEGDPYYCVTEKISGELRVMQYRSPESAFVEQVKILGDDSGKEPLGTVCIVLRIERNPIIGDKFASRHGQKGICSRQWPAVDMPFTESGMMPDIIFNPHGFPSRMTIGMMIESMAGKSASVHGLCHDATPFKYSEEEPPIDYFGRMLEAAGYNYFGTERFYSGIDGRELEADIFMGVVYYQRLRHMVSDKFQVRTHGPVDILTHQPVKGRKRAGGIRFGEMERDSLLSHGTSFLLEDRLLNCSDKDIGHVCMKCCSILSPIAMMNRNTELTLSSEKKQWVCTVCEESGSVKAITIPYVFRYLSAELASMNIKMSLELKEAVDQPAL